MGYMQVTNQIPSAKGQSTVSKGLVSQSKSGDWIQPPPQPQTRLQPDPDYESALSEYRCVRTLDAYHLV